MPIFFDFLEKNTLLDSKAINLVIVLTINPFLCQILI